MEVEEPVLQTKSPEVQSHVRSYLAFTQLLKWSTIATAIIAYIVMLIISD